MDLVGCVCAAEKQEMLESALASVAKQSALATEARAAAAAAEEAAKALAGVCMWVWAWFYIVSSFNVTVLRMDCACACQFYLVSSCVCSHRDWYVCASVHMYTAERPRSVPLSVRAYATLWQSIHLFCS